MNHSDRRDEVFSTFQKKARIHWFWVRYYCKILQGKVGGPHEERMMLSRARMSGRAVGIAVDTIWPKLLGGGGWKRRTRFYPYVDERSERFYLPRDRRNQS